jgi:surfeit locus 1 family protein
MIPRIRRATHAALPALAGTALLALFVTLGFWQLDRAQEKREVRAAFEAQGEYRTLATGETYERFTPLKAVGRFLERRQILLENIVLDGRIGYYVITPFELSVDEPLLLVNRGWLPKQADESAAPPIAVDDQEVEIRGRVGHLPRVGIRPGPAFADATGWPRRAVWPETQEIAAVLGREVLPFVLLADPDPSSGLVRRWQPQEIGPMRHLGYAVQWFALALAVIVTAVILFRRQRSVK